MGVIETTRDEEFAPIKNAEGADSPESARLAIARLHKSYLEKCGLEFAEEPDGREKLLEIDSMLTYQG